jgi:hypothetical protein
VHFLRKENVMCARNIFACLFAAAVLVTGFSGCTGGEEPVVKTEEETEFIPIEKAVDRLNRPKGYQRKEAIQNLQRAWKAGELQKRPAAELQNIRLVLGGLAQSDPETEVKKAAKELLTLMNQGAGAAPAEQPAEG